MFGMGKKQKRRCGICRNINCTVYGKDTPVCYKVCQNKDRPVATAVTINDKRAEYCGSFQEKG